ncbi:MAG: zinc ribbon domain-containing protein [bacterium]
MPTYEFRCPEGHEFEKFYRTISGAESVSACPQCGKIAERMMSAAGFAFKGSGFYLTDYGKNAHREKGSPDGKAASSAKESASDSGKSESPKAEGGSSSAGAESSSAAGGDSKKGDAKVAEAKPAAPAPKPSTGE